MATTKITRRKATSGSFKKGHPGYNKKANSGSFKKGHIPPFKGTKGMGIAKATSGSFKKGHASNIGKRWTLSEESRINIGNGHRGEKNVNWKGGISKNPYPKEFNKALKLKIRTRDNFTCCRCGKTEREELEAINQVLCVNHIDFDKKNCSEENLNTLCLRCNVQIGRDREYWTQYFQQ